jgi:hypothetical protein
MASTQPYMHDSYQVVSTDSTTGGTGIVANLVIKLCRIYLEILSKFLDPLVFVLKEFHTAVACIAFEHTIHTFTALQYKY